MSESLSLQAQSRSTLGTAHAKRMRKCEGMVPAVLYGAKEANQAIVLAHKAVMMALDVEGVAAQIIDLHLDGAAPIPVILKSVQQHPSQRKVLHLDLQRVEAKSALTIKVPMHFLGEDQCAALKGDGVMQHLMKEVEVHCLPRDLPKAIDVDVSALGMDEAIHLSALKLPKGVQLTALMAEPPHDDVVVSVHHAKVDVAAEDNPDAAPEVHGEAAASTDDGTA